MNSWLRSATIGSMLVLSVMAAGVPATAASRVTRWVDDDGRAGPAGCGTSRTAYRHIQSAVDASGPDDTVIVCPGTYVEQVRVAGPRDGLTLRASIPFGATIKAPAALVTKRGARSIVLIDRVNRVTIAGFKVASRAQLPCETVDAGILAVGARQVQIRGNRILATGASPDAPCYQGYGVLLADIVRGGSSSDTASGTIAFNQVRDPHFMGIGAFARAGGVRAHIVHNSVRAYFGSLPVGGSAIPGAPTSAEYGIGVLGRARATVEGNVVQGAGAAPVSGATFFVGIVVSGSFLGAGTPLTNGVVDVHDNLVRRVRYGLQIEGSDSVTAVRNKISNTGSAAFIQASHGILLRNNQLAAKELGVFVDAASAHNVIDRNTVTGIGGSCTDASAGTGTRGTANTWTRNSATVVGSPAGLCAVP